MHCNLVLPKRIFWCLCVCVCEVASQKGETLDAVAASCMPRPCLCHCLNHSHYACGVASAKNVMLIHGKCGGFQGLPDWFLVIQWFIDAKDATESISIHALSKVKVSPILDSCFQILPVHSLHVEVKARLSKCQRPWRILLGPWWAVV